MSENAARPLVLVTGMSGAGLSTALKVFEDMGFEAVDNLRLDLVPELVDAAKDAAALAVAVDARNASFSIPSLLAMKAKLSERTDWSPSLVFLDCSDETLQQRFTVTRRRHPLAFDRPVSDGIKMERDVLQPLKAEADTVVDTSLMSLHDLRRHLVGMFKLEAKGDLSIFVLSFSYRSGLPREADIVFDARFLANPHWDPALRPLTGMQPEVAAYIQKDQDYQSFMERLSGLLLPLLPRYQQEGKSYLTVAIGCTGGRHRSVLVAEELATRLAQSGYVVGIGHRELDRAAKNA